MPAFSNLYPNTNFTLTAQSVMRSQDASSGAAQPIRFGAT